MKKPAVSIIMPVHNADRFLSAAVESMLSQTWTDFEFIIINDASTDKTITVLKRYKDKRIRLLQHCRKIGVAESLNIGLLLAKGEYIARMDGDDVSFPKRLETQITYLKMNPDVGLVGSAVELIDEHDASIGIKRLALHFEEVRHQLMYKNPFIHSAMMFRKSLYSYYGGYDPHLEGAEDYDLWNRYCIYTKAENIPEVLLQYRVNSASVSVLHEGRIHKAYAKVQIKKIMNYGYHWGLGVFAIKGYLGWLFCYLKPSKKELNRI